MATRKAKISLVKVTLNVGADDWEFMKENYPKTGAGAAVRRLIATHVQRIREVMKTRQVDIEKIAVEIDL